MIPQLVDHPLGKQCNINQSGGKDPLKKTGRNRKAIRVGTLKTNEMEKQLYQFNFPNLTKKQYDQVWDEVRKAGHSNPVGLLHHVSSFQNNKCFVVDIWESSEAFDRYSKILIPIFEGLGVRMVNPTVSPVHFEYSGVEAHVTH